MIIVKIIIVPHAAQPPVVAAECCGDADVQALREACTPSPPTKSFPTKSS